MILALAWILAGSVAVPALVLALECAVGACRSVRPGGIREADRLPCIVLMPAHDEARGIAAAVAAVLAQLRGQDELVVVADNCTDDTAAIARSLGATVIERVDPVHRGKGHALEFGRAFIEGQRAGHPFATVIVIDADCLPLAGAIRALSAASTRRDAVVQGAYLMTSPADAEPVVRVSCFAFLIKNLVRQLGLDGLAGAALLQGSGMAFPRPVFAGMRWSAASLVEDLDMGVDLLLAGQRVVFEGAAGFTSAASSARGTAGQRRRWEHGMIQSATRFVPRLIAAACAGRPRLAFVALDLLVPPTVLLIVLLAGATALCLATLGLATLGLTTLDLAGPTLLLLGAGLALAATLTAAWWRHGRAVLPAASLGRIPGYVLWKLPLLVQFVTRRERNWIRTERGP
ncbi:glycosyltransferase family 2 protein [Novosphingobium sp. BL-8H]|uniref:glycosyltransferase family 2 protein n=1 Tax=Novosphingobium sp. BL-8H TaxID=3127640 RepID=UPI00375645F4